MANWKVTSGPIRLDSTDFGRAFDRLIRTVYKPRDLLGIAGMTMLEGIRKAFDAGRDPGTGQAWKKNRPNTVASKGSSRINYDTGYMRRSLAKGKAGNIFRLSNDSVVVGTRVKHAIFAQEGTKAHRIRPKREGGMLRFTTTGGTVFAREVKHPGTPKRRIIGVTKKTLGIVASRQAAHLDKVAKGGK